MKYIQFSYNISLSYAQTIFSSILFNVQFFCDNPHLQMKKCRFKEIGSW